MVLGLRRVIKHGVCASGIQNLDREEHADQDWIVFSCSSKSILLVGIMHESKKHSWMLVPKA